MTSLKPGFYLDLFAFCCSFWFFVPAKNQNNQCNVQIETSTRKPKRATKVITSNERHLPVLVFAILILRTDSISETRTSNEEQKKTTNDKWKHSPKTKTSNNKQLKPTKNTFDSHVHSFVPSLDLWKVIDIKSNGKPERATTGNEKQRKAGKRNEEQQKAKTA